MGNLNMYHKLIIKPNLFPFTMPSKFEKEVQERSNDFINVGRDKKFKNFANYRVQHFKQYNNIKPNENLLVLRLLRMTSLHSLITSGSTFLLLTKAFASFIKMYLLLLFLRVLLGWFPTFNWDANPWQALRQVTDPYLNLFRGLVPPLMGQIDLTPLIGFHLLQMLSSILMAPFADDPDVW